MKSIRYVLAGTVLAAGAALSAAVDTSIASTADGGSAAPPGTPQGWHAGGPHGHGHGFGPERLFRRLDLSDAQKASIKSLYVAARPQMTTLGEQMRANHQKLSQTTPDDPNYAAVVATVAQANATLASQRTTQEAALRTQMYAVLTPTQKTQLATLEAARAANRERGHWGRRGPRPEGSAPPPGE